MKHLPSTLKGVGLSVEMKAVLKKLASGTGNLDAEVISTIKESKKYATGMTEQTALAMLRACYQILTGEQLDPPQSPKTNSQSSGPASQIIVEFPEDGSDDHNPYVAPEWKCINLNISTSARCDIKEGSIAREDNTVKGWKSRPTGTKLACNRDGSIWGKAFAQGKCKAEGTTLHLYLANKLVGRGGYTKTCSGEALISTHLGYRTRAGGATLEISGEDVGKYDFWVDEIACSDSKREKVQTHLTVTYMDMELPVKPQTRISLSQPGLIDLRFHGEAELVSDGSEDEIEAHGSCWATVSLRPSTWLANTLFNN